MSFCISSLYSSSSLKYSRFEFLWKKYILDSRNIFERDEFLYFNDDDSEIQEARKCHGEMSFSISSL